MNYRTYRIDCDKITDWESFHAVSVSVFEFPEYYGRNMNAWIDCLSDFDSPVVIQLEGAKSFQSRCQEIYAAIVECSSFINWRMIEAGDEPLIFLSIND
jgi:RNAse (barnase) inhibitor barstar